MADKPHLKLVKKESEARVTMRARREFWFAQYVAMGPARSLQKLSRFRHPDGTETPAYQTLKRWSSEENWTDRILEQERQVQAKVEEKVVEDRAEQIAESERARRATANLFRTLIQSAMTIEVTDPVAALAGERLVIGRKTAGYHDLPKGTIDDIVKLHRAAEYTELMLDGKPTDRVQVQGDKDAPIIYQPMPADTQDEIRAAFRNVVEKLEERKRAQSKRSS